MQKAKAYFLLKMLCQKGFMTLCVSCIGLTPNPPVGILATALAARRIVKGSRSMPEAEGFLVEAIEQLLDRLPLDALCVRFRVCTARSTNGRSRGRYQLLRSVWARGRKRHKLSVGSASRPSRPSQCNPRGRATSRGWGTQGACSPPSPVYQSSG